MALLRYLLYFLGIGLVTGLIVGLELWLPGSLNLQYFADPADQLGTSEYSPLKSSSPESSSSAAFCMPG